ncbi:glycosyltransferase [Actinotalea sp. JY-7876]|uniref:glycosyltransferase n=1 Tax=Actinotalea sp. JY-7876 TaxID=2758442 RepID=UPI0015F3B1E5|nr:glycosyltransferase [Actinotalea sp. JY-7876]
MSTGAVDPQRVVVAVVTAFRPDERLAEVVRSAADQCDRVLVVDNTPTGEPGAQDRIGDIAGVQVERSGRNLGLAGALNLGSGLSRDAWALLLLDQDSALPAGAVAALARHLEREPAIGVATPVPWDAGAGRYLDPRAARRPELADLVVAITSGMLVRRTVLDAVGPFREDFFVDAIDQDFCLRVRRAGFRVVQDRTVPLPHSLGETRWRGWGPLRLRSTQHPTWRLYWAARNAVVLARENWRREPVWVATSLALLGYVALTVLLFEPPRAARLRAMAHGLADGWAGRTDPAQRPGGAA